MVQIPPVALPDFWFQVFILFSPFVLIGFIVVLIIYSYINRETREDKISRKKAIQKKRYPDFKMDLNRSFHESEQDQDS
ncbi:MAG: hypothetical protein ACFFE6_09640 [Candidatus Thorarchaeota archaeon]